MLSERMPDRFGKQSTYVPAKEVIMVLTELFSMLSGNQPSSVTGIRRRISLVPTNGEGSVVVPASLGGQYIIYPRRGDGHSIPIAIFDTMQAQANRMEKALLTLRNNGTISLPLVVVRCANGKEITTLDAPHRLGDDVFYNAVLPDGTPFRKSQYAKWNNYCENNVTDLFGLCPTALIFGQPKWGQNPWGFPRALTSEVEGQVISVGHNGVTVSDVWQTAFLSKFIWRYKFPLNKTTSTHIDEAGHRVLVALALLAVTAAFEQQFSLRRGCDLKVVEPTPWEILRRGQVEQFDLCLSDALEIYNSAVVQAKEVGLPWMEEPLLLNSGIRISQK
jgi:CRISPR-associated protein Csb1